jgi:hypothetical protein
VKLLKDALVQNKIFNGSTSQGMTLNPSLGIKPSSSLHLKICGEEKKRGKNSNKNIQGYRRIFSKLKCIA